MSVPRMIQDIQGIAEAFQVVSGSFMNGLEGFRRFEVFQWALRMFHCLFGTFCGVPEAFMIVPEKFYRFQRVPWVLNEGGSGVSGES